MAQESRLLIFKHNGTTIPQWACKMWRIENDFSTCISKGDPQSEVTVDFKDKQFKCWVTIAREKRQTPAYRFWFEKQLTYELKRIKASNIEEEIPFWEFLDIEYERKVKRFKFEAYYTKWHKREELEFELRANNVLYYLLDTKNKLFYVGEAANLVDRLMQIHPSIPDWDHFRYDVLPNELFDYGVTLERMTIRDFASILRSRDPESTVISQYKLANDRFDI